MLSGNCLARTDGFATVFVPPPPYLLEIKLPPLPHTPVDFVTLPLRPPTCGSPLCGLGQNQLMAQWDLASRSSKSWGARLNSPNNKFISACHAHQTPAELPSHICVKRCRYKGEEFQCTAMQCTDAGDSDTIELEFWHRPHSPLSAP